MWVREDCQSAAIKCIIDNSKLTTSVTDVLCCHAVRGNIWHLSASSLSCCYTTYSICTISYTPSSYTRVMTPVSRQIWWIQMLGGRPQARFHSCDGCSPSLTLVEVQRIWLAGRVCESPATWPKRLSPHLQIVTEISSRPYGEDLHHCRRSHAKWRVECVVDTAYGRSPVFYNQFV